MARQLISSGSSFERQIGYSETNTQSPCTTARVDYATMTIAEGVVERARQCLKNIESALHQAGASLKDAVRVTYVLPNSAEFSDCWPVLRKYLGDIRPAATMISAGLADPRIRIENEVTALKQSKG